MVCSCDRCRSNANLSRWHRKYNEIAKKIAQSSVDHKIQYRKWVELNTTGKAPPLNAYRFIWPVVRWFPSHRGGVLWSEIIVTWMATDSYIKLSARSWDGISWLFLLSASLTTKDNNVGLSPWISRVTKGGNTVVVMETLIYAMYMNL